MKKKTGIIQIGVCAVVFMLAMSGCQAKDMLSDMIEGGSHAGEARTKDAAGTLGPAEKQRSIWETGDLADTEEDGAVPVVSISAERYVYSTLDDETKLVYDEIYQAIEDYETKVKVDTLDAQVLDDAYWAVGADYGEIFWVSGYEYTKYTIGEAVVALEFSPQYTMDEGERDQTRKQIDAAVNDILAGAPPASSSDYEKARFVFEYLASHVDYEITASDNQNIISVFLNQKTVCQGYANATQYLLQCLGIQSAIVSGTAEGEPHAWNLVRMDGSYYYIDTTWGNSVYTTGDTGESQFVNYSYFGVTSEEMGATHRSDKSFVLPECTAIADNYYIREGRYFEEWNPDAVGAVCLEAYEGGAETVSVKFATDELYQQMRQYMITEWHITDYCNGLSSFYYVEDAAQRVLIFRFA